MGRLPKGNVHGSSVSHRFIPGQLLYSYYLLQRRKHHNAIVLTTPGVLKDSKTLSKAEAWKSPSSAIY